MNRGVSLSLGMGEVFLLQGDQAIGRDHQKVTLLRSHGCEHLIDDHAGV